MASNMLHGLKTKKAEKHPRDENTKATILKNNPE